MLGGIEHTRGAGGFTRWAETMIPLGLIVILGLMLSTSPAVAHHSFEVEYNITKPVVLRGTISSFEWANPHSSLVLEISDDRNLNGPKLWRIEGGPVSFLNESGWSPAMLQQIVKSHATVAITGYRAIKTPAANFAGGVWATVIELPDGRKLRFHE